MIVNFDEFNSIPSVFYHQSNDLKDQPYLWKKDNDKYVSLSWKLVKEQVELGVAVRMACLKLFCQ